MTRDAAVCLTIPGLGNSTDGHWQTTWERERDDCRRIELGHWHAPIRDVWVGRIDAAVSFARGSVVLVAHSLGCTAVAWWASEAGVPMLEKVRGAMLVAPPDLDRPDMPREVSDFRPTPQRRLPFRSVVIASSNDPYASLAVSARMAKGWGAKFVDVGPRAHLNAAAKLGSWEEGQAILDGLANFELNSLPAGHRPA